MGELVPAMHREHIVVSSCSPSGFLADIAAARNKSLLFRRFDISSVRHAAARCSWQPSLHTHRQVFR